MTLKVDTFVFIDLETTSVNKSRSKITEISMLAVSRKDFLEMGEGVYEKLRHIKGPPSLPRVVDKFTKLCYPNQFIDPKVEDITGLSNDKLLDRQPFNKDVAQAIEYFLKLNKNIFETICFIAHNGLKFDFPVLKAELLQCGYNNIEGIYCADSLICAREFAAKDIQSLSELCCNDFDPEFENICQSLESKQYSSLKSDVISSKIDDKIPLSYNLQHEKSNATHSVWPCSEMENTTSLDFKNGSANIFKTPKKLTINSSVSTPKKCKFSPVFNAFTPESKVHKINPQNSDTQIQHLINILKKRKGFSQKELFKTLFSTTYAEHRAEDDATALMQICSCYGNDLVEWVDKNKILFRDVNPRWISTPQKVLGGLEPSKPSAKKSINF